MSNNPSLVIASSDIRDIKKSSPEAASAILANMNIDQIYEGRPNI